MEVGIATTHSILLRLVLALLLGALIGAERQYRQQYTGLVTHALVAMGAAAYSSLPGALGMGLDLRMGAQVVTGIGFLGAGLIIRDGSNIKGLSTSATIWSTGSVGVFIGYGFLLLAAETAMFILILNSFLPRLSKFFEKYSSDKSMDEQQYMITVRCNAENFSSVREDFLTEVKGIPHMFQSLSSNNSRNKKEIDIFVTLSSSRSDIRSIEGAAAKLAQNPKVHSVLWKKLDKNSKISSDKPGRTP